MYLPLSNISVYLHKAHFMRIMSYARGVLRRFGSNRKLSQFQRISTRFSTYTYAFLSVYDWHFPPYYHRFNSFIYLDVYYTCLCERPKVLEQLLIILTHENFTKYILRSTYIVPIRTNQIIYIDIYILFGLNADTITIYR